jgi:hypothetical protein
MFDALDFDSHSGKAALRLTYIWVDYFTHGSLPNGTDK